MAIDILMVDLGYVWGGQEVYSHSLMSGLAERGCGVDSLSSQPRFAEQARHHFPANGAYRMFPALARQVARLQRQYDVVHFNGNRALYLSRIVPKHRPFVGTKHSPFVSGGGFSLRSAGARLSPFLFGTIDQLITVSAAAYRELPRSVQERTRVIANGVPSCARPEVARADTFTVAYVGRLNRDKGVMDVLQGVKWLLEQGLELRALIAGEGELRSEVESYVQANGLGRIVKLLGFVNDPGWVYSQAHVCLLPSRHEGMPLTLLEALSAGCPAVCYDIPGLDEVIETGRNGFRVPMSSRDLAQAILRIARDEPLWRLLSQNAVALYQQKFALTRMIHETFDVYSTVVARRHDSSSRA
jgi:glycosyltransferase involved in cell wall biosynthesis